MTARNDITGDSIQTKSNTAAYLAGWERIFAKNKLQPVDADKSSEEQEDKNCSEKQFSSQSAG